LDLSRNILNLLHNYEQPNNENITSLNSKYNFGVSKITNANVKVIGIKIVYQPINLSLLELVTYYDLNYANYESSSS